MTEVQTKLQSLEAELKKIKKAYECLQQQVAKEKCLTIPVKVTSAKLF